MQLYKNIYNKIRTDSYRYLALLLMILLFSSIFLTGCGNVQPLTITGYKLNTIVSITVYDKIDQSVLDKCLDLCDVYENMFSRTIATSDLAKLNNHEITQVPKDVGILIEYGIRYAELSGGSFDPSIGSISSLWDFTTNNPKVPEDSAIKAGLSYVNYKDILISKNNEDQESYSVIIPQGMMIDLGAIAKGYIADKLKEYLLSCGIENAIINLGGNILCIGSKPDHTAFHIAIKKPFTETGETLMTLKIDGKSVVSTGTYERCFTIDGKSYHHIINPKTGYPYENELTSVTIISNLSVEGDCLSTTCFTLGLEKGMELINSLDEIEAIFVTKDGSLHYSDGAIRYLK